MAQWVQALALGLDPSWRRQAPGRRCEDARQLVETVEGWQGVRSLTYSTVGIEPGVDLVLWRLADSPEALEEAGAACLRAGLGRWLRVAHSFLGIGRPSPYARRPPPELPALFTGDRSRYLVVYPFTKTAGWYLMEDEARRTAMTEHMRIGHFHPEVRQLLANSFGIDDQDFLVAYETDDLAGFSDLVRELRATEGRRYTADDTPLLLGIHRPLPEITRLLGAV
jgi:chlorite dismutase